MNKENNTPFVWRNSKIEPKYLSEFLIDNYYAIKQKLLSEGVVLFKSFNIDTPTKLEECVSVFPGNAMNYIDGNSPRKKLQGKVYTSTEHPADAFISLHNELSYSNAWPKYLFFSCAIPAIEGGSTLIADSRKILQDLSEELKQTFAEKGVKYIRNLHGGHGLGPSWQDTFETFKKDEVEKHCSENDLIYEWNGDDLKLVQHRAAIIQHSETKEQVWFNQADQFHPSTNDAEVYEALMEIYEGSYDTMPQYACFGDDSDIPLIMLEEIREVTKKHTVTFAWEKGDMMIVDNVLVAHGRSPYKGPRKVLVSMSN